MPELPRMANTSKSYFHIPARKPRSAPRRFIHIVASLMLAPPFFLLALFHKVPGLRIQWQAFWLAVRMLPRASRTTISEIYRLMIWPMDSVRYFEFDFSSRIFEQLRPKRVLDVSSPRLFPVLKAVHHQDAHFVLLNPDKNDLQITRDVVEAAGAGARCTFLPALVADCGLAAGSFDLITCISVLEHIPNDREALAAIWDLLKPGGDLLLTVPCAADFREEFVDHDGYGLLNPDERGFYFFQRFYDDCRLATHIFPITGPPLSSAVYGEKTAGLYHANMEEKQSSSSYPAWRESIMMSQDYRYFSSLHDLPGIGVMALHFRKSQDVNPVP